MMTKEIKVGVIGLDTSHSVEFIKRMQAPDCPAEQRVTGLRATACLRFETPFQNKDGLDARQKQLEDWGVKVTEDFAVAVADCDAVMIEINDPARHLEYFRKCAVLVKPIYLDKPLADTLTNGKAIAELVAERGLKIMSCSSLRFVPGLVQACATVAAPTQATTFGPLGKAPAGSSIVWYGVHAFEMLERVMGRGAAEMTVVKDRSGVVAVIGYEDGRRGVVELTEGGWSYGGCIRNKAGAAASYVVDMSRAYTMQLAEVETFFRTGIAPLAIADTVEIMALLDAAQRAHDSGKPEKV